MPAMPRSWMSLLTAIIFVFVVTACLAQAAPSQSPEPSAPAVANAPASAGGATPVEEEDDDSPDIPPFARSRTSASQYLQMRDQQLRLQRGLDDLVNDPQARSRAIRSMEIQEQSVNRQRAAAASRRGAVVTSIPGPAWTALGPAPIPNGQTITNTVSVSGRVTAIVIDPSDSNVVYVGTAQGGLYRTLDGGATWTPLMDLANSLAIGAITIDPNNHTTLFVGTGEGNLSLDSFFGVGLYIIQNATTTANLSGPFNAPTISPNPDGFTDVFTGRAITKILVNPGNSNQILVSTSSGFSGASGDVFSTLPTRGVYLSVNALGGSPTFARLSIQPAADKNRPVTDMAMDPNNPSTAVVYVFGQLNGAVYDGEGGVWTSNNVWAATPAWAQTYQAGANENGKLAANHVGSTTTVLLALDLVASGPICNGKHGTLFKSTDAFATLPTELNAARGFCGGQCFYDMPVAIDPGNASNIYIGGSAGNTVGSCGSSALGKSTNGGTSFAASEPSLHADTHAIAIFPGNANIIYEGNDGGIFRSADAGATWTSRNTAGFNATQFESIAVHPTDPNFTIGGTQDNGTPFLQPNGTWTRADFGDGGFSAIDQNAANTSAVTMYHTYFNQSNNLVGFAQVTNVASASDGLWNFFGCQGTTPANGITCADAVLFYAPLALGPGSPNTVYYGTDRLYRSADSGNNNTVVSQAPISAAPLSAIGISPQDDNVRIVGLANGQVWATTSGSSTLTDVTGPWTAKYIARTVIDPNNKFTAYVTLDGYGVATGHVWKTTTLSAVTPTWTSMSSGIPDIPVNALAVDPGNSNNVYAGTDIGVYNSTDGGATWNPYGTGLPRVAVFDLKLTAGHKVRIATHGRGMWEIAAVGSLATTSAVSFSPPNPVFGNTITFTGTVNTGTSVIPATGSVTFIDNTFATTLGSGTVTTGSATFLTSTLGGGPHSITAQYSGDGNYLGSTSPAVVVNVINASNADFSVNFPSSSVTVKAGVPASYTANIKALNGFGGTINFACSGLPSLTSCSFSPATVMVSNNTGSTTLTISTTAPTAAPPGGNLNSGLLTGGGFLALGIVLAGVVTGKRRRWRPAFLLMAVLALAAVLGSCGGGGGTPPPVVHNPGTPPGSYGVTVTSGSGILTKQSVITLVVQ